jgi:HEAT repeat protein
MSRSSSDASLFGGEPEDVVEHLNSDDGDTRSRALGELIARGKKAVPALLKVLKGGEARARFLAAEGLASIADPATADTLYEALEDDDDKVRAHAATGLMKIGDPRALDALVRTINDFPDVLSEYSLSTFALAQYGPKALPAVAPLLKAPEQWTRAKAIYIFRKILSQPSGGGTDPELQKWLQAYNASAPEAERDEMADKLIARVKGGRAAAKQTQRTTRKVERGTKAVERPSKKNG